VTTGFDTYDRVDSNTSANPPTSGANYGTIVGTWGIASNELKRVTSGAAIDVLLETVGADGYIEGIVGSNPEDGMGWAFRYVDASNNFVLQRNSSFGTWNIYRNVAGGGYTFVDNLGTVNTSTGAVIRIAFFGSRLRFYVDGALVKTVTDTNFQTTGTKAGPMCTSTVTAGARWNGLTWANANPVPFAGKAPESDSAKATMVARRRPVAGKSPSSSSSKATRIVRAVRVGGKAPSSSSAKATQLKIPHVHLAGKAATADKAKALRIVERKSFRAKVSSSSSAKATPTIVSPPYRNPVDRALDQILAGARLLRRVDIYNPDGTLYAYDVPFTSYDVTVDAGRAERRSLDCLLDNSTGVLDFRPGAFWFDKVVRVFRGVELDRDDTYVPQVGEFFIDIIERSNFPRTTLHVTGRDAAKVLAEDCFGLPQLFTTGMAPEDVIRQIATGGGLTKFSLAATGQTLGADVTFDSGTSRWDACQKTADAFALELYVDPGGYLVERPFLDPAVAPLAFTFKTGAPDGNLADFTPSASGASLYNHVLVTGKDSAGNAIIGEAENHDPTSPTSIENLGRRSTWKPEADPLLTTVDQCNARAAQLLAHAALVDYTVNADALVIPWLDAGEIVGFLDPDADEGEPTRYRLASFPISSNPGTSAIVLQRVTMLGGAS